MSAFGVRRAKAALSSGCKSHPATAPAGSNRSSHVGAVMEVTKWLKPSIIVSRIGDSASVQAATRVKAEQASKRTMCRPTRLPYRGRLKWLGEMNELILGDYLASVLNQGYENFKGSTSEWN